MDTTSAGGLNTVAFKATGASNTCELGTLFNAVAPLPTKSLVVVEELVWDAELLRRAGSLAHTEALTSMLSDVSDELGKTVGVGRGALQVKAFLRLSFATEIVPPESACTESQGCECVVRLASRPPSPSRKHGPSVPFPFSLTVSPLFDWSSL